MSETRRKFPTGVGSEDLDGLQLADIIVLSPLYFGACIGRTGWKAKRLSGRSCQSYADIVRGGPAILLCLGQTFPADFTQRLG
jgi:hypothetical protein